MVSKVGNFLKYNNLVPITLSVVLLGSATTFAATNPDVIIDSEEQILSIDNTYIAEINLRNFTPSVTILQVKEDNEFYYVEYEFTTIELLDGVWQDVTTPETMKIPRSRLGKYRDLGLYVTEELNEKIKAEEKRLAETQQFEKRQVTRKKVNKTYKGLVGGFLSSEVRTIDKYKPVIKPPKPRQEPSTFARPPAVPPRQEAPERLTIEEQVESIAVQEPVVAGTTSVAVPTAETGTTTERDGAGSDTGGSSGAAADTATSSGRSNEPPLLTILGDNPVRIPVGERYTDLGAAVTDDHDMELTVEVFVDGVPVDQVQLNTTTATTYSVFYQSTDREGAVGQAERIVQVFVPADVIMRDPRQETETPTSTGEVVNEPATSTANTTPELEAPDEDTTPSTPAPTTANTTTDEEKTAPDTKVEQQPEPETPAGEMNVAPEPPPAGVSPETTATE